MIRLKEQHPHNIRLQWQNGRIINVSLRIRMGHTITKCTAGVGQKINKNGDRKVVEYEKKQWEE